MINDFLMFLVRQCRKIGDPLDYSMTIRNNKIVTKYNKAGIALMLQWHLLKLVALNNLRKRKG